MHTLTTGTEIDSILSPMSRFSSAKGNRVEKKNRVIEKFVEFAVIKKTAIYKFPQNNSGLLKIADSLTTE